MAALANKWKVRSDTPRALTVRSTPWRCIFGFKPERKRKATNLRFSFSVFIGLNRSYCLLRTRNVTFDSCEQSEMGLTMVPRKGEDMHCGVTRQYL